MKKLTIVAVTALFLLSCSACAGTPVSDTVSVQDIASSVAESDTTQTSSDQSDPEQQTTVQNAVPPKTETEERRITMQIGEDSVTILLYDTPAADSLYNMLPLELDIEDFNSTEKIAYLSESLDTEGESDSFDPDVGDVCLYAPWGNLSIFYQDFRVSDSLISLGKIESGIELIETMPDGTTFTLSKSE